MFSYRLPETRGENRGLAKCANPASSAGTASNGEHLSPGIGNDNRFSLSDDSRRRDSALLPSAINPRFRDVTFWERPSVGPSGAAFHALGWVLLLGDEVEEL